MTLLAGEGRLCHEAGSGDCRTRRFVRSSVRNTELRPSLSQQLRPPWQRCSNTGAPLVRPAPALAEKSLSQPLAEKPVAQRPVAARPLTPAPAAPVRSVTSYTPPSTAYQPTQSDTSPSTTQSHAASSTTQNPAQAYNPSTTTHQPMRTYNPPTTTYQPTVAKSGSRYGGTSRATGRSNTVHVRGYYRKDGTYVRSHYRSAPRRR